MTDARASTSRKGALGVANVITATICETTGNKPADVCTNPAIQSIQKQLPTK